MTITIGIDVCKTHLDVFDSHYQKHHRFTNDTQGIETLLDLYAKEDVKNCRIIMESTGTYQRRLQQAATLKGMDVFVVNPYRVRQFARSLGKRAKTDKWDAKILTSYGQKVDLKALIKRTPNELYLADLLRCRKHLVDTKIAHHNHLEAQEDPDIVTLLKGILKTLQEKIKECEKKIRHLIKEDAELLKKHALLMTAPGVGEITSWHLLAFLPELGKVSREEIAALCGVAPIVHQSGAYRGRAMIQGGRSTIRHVLYMGVLALLRGKSLLKEKYDRLRDKGKPAKVALIACMRQLLVRLNLMMRKQEAWMA